MFLNNCHQINEIKIKARPLCFKSFILIALLIILFVADRVWNDAVAHRLATLGHSARRGDLVWMPEGQSKADDGGETSCAQVTEDYDYNPQLCLNHKRSRHQISAIQLEDISAVDGVIQGHTLLKGNCTCSDNNTSFFAFPDPCSDRPRGAK